MMNEEYIKRLDFDSDTFEAMKTDMNFILQRMIGSMIEKDSTEGSMTIKIDVNMVTEWIPNNNPDIEGETRMIRKPQFKHKCASTIKINDEKSGSFNNEMELDMNENGCYYLKPVADTTQRTIFDSDFQSGMNKPESDKEDDSGIIDGTFKELPGDSTPALPCNDDSGSKDESDAPAEGKPEDSTDNAPDSPETDENGTDNISSADDGGIHRAEDRGGTVFAGGGPVEDQGGAADLLRDALQVDAVFLHHQGRVPGRDE